MKYWLLGVCMLGIGHFQSASAEILFQSSFESGLHGDESWIIDKKKQCLIEIDKQVARSGSASVRFESGSGARCEILPWFYNNFITYHLREPYGEDRWYAFSVFLKDRWEYSAQNEVIAQWHSSKDVILREPSGRGPPLALRIIKGVWRITYGWDANFLSKKGPKAIYPLWVGPIEPGKWTDWVFRVRWTRGDEDGLAQIWKDGQLIVDHKGHWRERRAVGS